MRSESEALEKLAFLEGQLANGNDPNAVGEISCVKWLLEGHNEQEVRDRLAYARNKFGKSFGKDSGVEREIDRLEWMLLEGPDMIHVPAVRAIKM